ncbi:hypothetical protein AYI68_g1190 [Smittium mucronatum]|uniref:MULE transposase domain-containing protein n=1 Tax=Smittium mucronatum TaxID=133383 RepID=A0A1R0H6C0_9FUNG|nr:hypothetical protein AYI68_g1190 [Smittium mucronatum]
MLSEAENMHLDSTFKLIDGNYPTIISGISDNKLSFCPVSIELVSSDNEDSYSWILSTLEIELKKIVLIWNIGTIIADSAQQILNAVENFQYRTKSLFLAPNIQKYFEKSKMNQSSVHK